MNIDPSDPPPEFGEAVLNVLGGIIATVFAVAFSGPIWPLLWPLLSLIHQPLGWAF